MNKQLTTRYSAEHSRMIHTIQNTQAKNVRTGMYANDEKSNGVYPNMVCCVLSSTEVDFQLAIGGV